MSSRLPCCFRVFYDYPNWRTGGSPFVPQVSGYLKTHIIHSFLTILNYKTVCACRSSIRDIPPVPNQPNMFKFSQRSFGQKKIERGFITMRQTTSRIVIYACCLKRRKVGVTLITAGHRLTPQDTAGHRKTPQITAGHLYFLYF